MAVIDIACPACGSTEPVRKLGIGSYRCTACDREFDREAIDPAGRVEEDAGR